MIRNIKHLVRDVLYVSKLTGISNKKLTVLIAVILSQLTAVSDVLIIVLFAGFITGSFEGIQVLGLIYNFVIEYHIITNISFNKICMYIFPNNALEKFRTKCK